MKYLLSILILSLYSNAEVKISAIPGGSAHLQKFLVNNQTLLGTGGLHWHVQLNSTANTTSAGYVNVMIDDGEQTKSFRMLVGVARKIEFLPKCPLSSDSCLYITLQHICDTPVKMICNVTVQNWNTDVTVNKEKDVSDVIEAMVDSPQDSSPSINYFYTSGANISTSVYQAWSVIPLTYLTTYLLVDIKAPTPHTCYLASLQNASHSPVDTEALIKR